MTTHYQPNSRLAEMRYTKGLKIGPITADVACEVAIDIAANVCADWDDLTVSGYMAQEFEKTALQSCQMIRAVAAKVGRMPIIFHPRKCILVLWERRGHRTHVTGILLGDQFQPNDWRRVDRGQRVTPVCGLTTGGCQRFKWVAVASDCDVSALSIWPEIPRELTLDS